MAAVNMAPVPLHVFNIERQPDDKLSRFNVRSCSIGESKGAAIRNLSFIATLHRGHATVLKTSLHQNFETC